MKRKISICLCILFMAIILSNCASTSTQQLDFSLHNTVSIFLLENEAGFFFSIPIQYLGDFHISSFEFIDGLIVIGDYKIPLLNDNLNISIYLNQKSDENGSLDSGFDLVLEKKRGNVLISKMIEPLTEQVESDGKYIHYYIFIERFLEDHEVEKIKNNYAKGNVYSRFEVWFNLIIDGEPQLENGVGDDFELYTGDPSNAVFLFPNLNFFRARYL